MKMLVTRPLADAQGTMRRLELLDIEPVAAPLLVKQVLDTPLPKADQFAAMAVSSTNALRALAERDALHNYRHLPVYAVGDRTAMQAVGMGFSNVTSAAGGFVELVDVLAEAKLGGPIFYPSAQTPSGDLGTMMSAVGGTVVTTPVYAMVAVTEMPQGIVQDIADGSIVAALLFSRRTATSFVNALADRLSPEQRSALSVLCISDAVAEPLVRAGFSLGGVSERPDEESMMSLALTIARARNAS
ncbi:uroporphyrinogen-III synthase [Devosia rhodophyticola]|uniref:Uroporphyrinogen-III synthase n=1 Tax=Devosia rhodophyticola TaxID=3026423 RepID=A0ABY7Z355_9HYPH|nr:uroporphyrinogen-III synthase [Devosia rhodophyticola]WDR07425.1 uroporphyrinogen-III synthase [Devosia rhodophyticola]